MDDAERDHAKFLALAKLHELRSPHPVWDMRLALREIVEPFKSKPKWSR